MKKESPVIDKAGVARLKTGEYQVIWPRPWRIPINAGPLAGSQKVKIFTVDESGEFIIGAEGKKQRLLEWLRLVDEEHWKEYELAMAE